MRGRNRWAMGLSLLLLGCGGRDVGALPRPAQARAPSATAAPKPPAIPAPDCPHDTTWGVSRTGPSRLRGDCRRADGVRHGPAVVMDAARRRRSAGEFVDGKRQGDWRWWTEDGALHQVANYHRDRRVGQMTRYHPDGVTPAAWGWSDSTGILDGWMFWHADGSKSHEGRFLNGEPVGIWQVSRGTDSWQIAWSSRTVSAFDRLGRSLWVGRYSVEATLEACESGPCPKTFTEMYPAVEACSDEDLEDVIDQAAQELFECGALATTPGGKIAFEWTIWLDGTVHHLEVVEDAVGAEVVTACMLTRLRRLRFPPPVGDACGVARAWILKPRSTSTAGP